MIKLLTKLTGRSETQTNMLLDLCDGDIERLIELERKIRNNFYFYCPDTKTEVKRIINRKTFKSDHYDWLTYDTVTNLNKHDNICQHIMTDFFGVIQGEMEGTDKFDAQYKIFWLTPSDGIKFMPSRYISIPDKSCHYTWTSKRLIRKVYDTRPD